MTGPARRQAATLIRLPAPARHHDPAVELWREAVKIGSEWLDHGLCTEPADRPSAERHLTAIYRRVGRPRPTFVWVDSPAAGLPLVGELPTLDQVYARVRNPRTSGRPPLAGDVAMAASQVRAALSGGVVHPDPELTPVRRSKRGDPWPERPPLEALRDGVPLAVVLHQGVRVALHRSLAHRLAHPVRDRLARPGRPMPVCWYGQQDAAWIAYYDALHRLGLARYGSDESVHLQHWGALARSCGWWWPGEDVCVVVERPATLHTLPVPGSWHDEVRPAEDGITYRDGYRPALT